MFCRCSWIPYFSRREWLELYEVRIVFADRDGFVVELLVSSCCGNNGRFPGRLIGRCRGEEVECREHGFAR